MKRTVTLAVRVMTLLVLIGGRVQPDTGKDAPFANVGRDLAVLFDKCVSYLKQRSGKTFKPRNQLLRIIDERIVIDALAAGDDQPVEGEMARSA